VQQTLENKLYSIALIKKHQFEYGAHKLKVF